VEDDLGLIQLLLDGRDVARLSWVLARIKMIPQCREGDFAVLGALGLDLAGGVLAEKLIDNFGEDGMGSHLRVILADNDGSDALGAGVAVEHVSWELVRWVNERE
jgi:hypothetical protein